MILGFGWCPTDAHPTTPTHLVLLKCHQHCSVQHTSADYLEQGKASSDTNINQNKSACPSAALNMPLLAFECHFHFCSHFAQPLFAQRYTTNPAPTFVGLGLVSAALLGGVYRQEKVKSFVSAAADIRHRVPQVKNWLKLLIPIQQT